MCKTSFKVTVFYDGTRTAKEVLNDAIAAKVRRKIDNDIEILEGKDYADITELDADTLNRLVKQIVVHEEITEDGDRNISMEIHYNIRPTDESKTYNLSEVAEANSDAKAM